MVAVFASEAEKCDELAAEADQLADRTGYKRVATILRELAAYFRDAAASRPPRARQ